MIALEPKRHRHASYNLVGQSNRHAVSVSTFIHYSLRISTYWRTKIELMINFLHLRLYVLKITHNLSCAALYTVPKRPEATLFSTTFLWLKYFWIYIKFVSDSKFHSKNHSKNSFTPVLKYNSQHRPISFKYTHLIIYTLPKAESSPNFYLKFIPHPLFPFFTIPPILLYFINNESTAFPYQNLVQTNQFP